MKIRKGKFNPETGRISVVFRYAGVTHKREVNACLDAEGKYDAAATAVRIEQVASGVRHKIEAGFFGPPTLPQPTQENANG